MDGSDIKGSVTANGGRFFLRLLGSPSLEVVNGPSDGGLGPGKSLALLAYLSVRGPARRDELISMLWGEIPEEKARNAFRQSLHRLRAVLGPDFLPQERGDQLAIRGDGYLVSDRETFVVACEGRRWEAAVQVYGGEFMEGVETGEPAFDRWADAERIRLRARYEEALLEAGQDAASGGRIQDALRYGQRLTATAPFDERAALFEANTLVAAGRPGPALAALHEFQARLKDELDIAVTTNVKTLIERLEKRGTRDTPPGGTSERGSVVSPFVGRDAELSRMLGLVALLRQERGATCLLEGEAGIGKSRLLDEFAERARTLGGVSILRGREAGLGGVLPYAGVADALRPIVRASGIAGASRHLLAEAARLLPELRDGFELPDVPPIEDETGRLRFFEGIAALIDAAAYEKPVVLVVDDAQHASPSTVDLLIYLSRRLHQSPVLLVISFRSDRGAGQIIERLRDLSAAGAQADAHVTLGPLSSAETEQLVASRVRGSAADAATIERIVRLSGGRPFAAGELANRAALGEMPSELPVTLRDALLARFQGASPSQRRIFFAASLLERSPSLRLLAAAAHLPEAAAFEAVEQLVRTGLLRRTETGYAVAHDCTLGFVVEASGLAGRALLAGWAADALAAEPDRSEAELAALYAMSGRSADAFTHARAAAFVAASVGASTEVTRLLGIALTFAPNDGARQEIDSLLTAFGRTRLSLPAPDSAAAAETEDEPAAAAASETTDDKPRRRRADYSPPWAPATVRQWITSVVISLLIVAAGFATRRAITARRTTATIADTLVVLERDARGTNAVRYETGIIGGSVSALAAAASGQFAPTWVDSLSRPWSAPLVSPDARRVAVQRITQRGAELFVISSDRRDTIPVASGGGDNLPLGWSPDSRALLVSRSRTLSDGSFDSDLFVIWAGSPAPAVPIDTSPARTIAEAKWSPTGAWVAWVARSGVTRQRDVFIARADGSEMRNLSANPADDYDISWAPDGSLLAFTSTRAGGTRLYVYDFDNTRLWPVSDRDNESHAVFSPDGRSLAFESTRDGDLAVYARPVLGGTVRRLTPVGRQFSINTWLGAPPSYVDRLRILGNSGLSVGDTVRLSVLGVTNDNRAPASVDARWSLPDLSVASSAGPTTGADSAAVRVVGRAIGNARVVTSIPGWRADTVVLAVNTRQPIHVEDAFTGRAIDARWIPLGSPAPYVGVSPGTGTPGVFPNGDLEWDSGLLLRSPIELRPGLHLRARVSAPFVGRPSQATLTLGFIPAVVESALDRQAPRFSSLIAVQWDGASGNLVYTVGPQTSSEIPPPSQGTSHIIEIEVEANRAVVFSVDGQVRWRSSLTFLGDVRGTPVQFWIGGRATGSSVAVGEFTLDLPERSAQP